MISIIAWAPFFIISKIKKWCFPEAIEKLNGILEGKGAKVEKVDESMGLRDLAYEINKETKGYYVVLKVSADEAALKEFTRLVSINPVVLRHLVVVDHE